MDGEASARWRQEMLARQVRAGALDWPPEARGRLLRAIRARHLGAQPLWRRAWWWLVGAPAWREDA